MTSSVSKYLYVTAVGNALLFFVFVITRHYYPLAMGLHLLSLLPLWLVVLRKTPHFTISKHIWPEILIVLLLFGLALFVGLYRSEELTPGMYGDEIEVARHAMALSHNPDWPPYDGTYYHPTPITYFTAASIALLGHTKTAIRFPSMVFTALSAVTFFMLLRLFFPFFIATLGGGLLVFQYTAIVLSRLAYEPPASLFWQFITLIFLTLYVKTKENLWLLGIALSIGGGLYTYLNFRPFALVIFLLTLFLIFKQRSHDVRLRALLFCVTLFVAAMPLWSYLLVDWQGFWGRTAEISIFSRHYSTVEFFKELGGNIYRIVGFPFIGDPNADKNPAGVTLFDPFTMLLALLGFIYLGLRGRSRFWMLLLLLIPPFLSDVFSTEVIPDFHYYGLGHPNALRVSGLIGVILFAACYGTWWIFSQMQDIPYKSLIISAGIMFICYWNWMLYFNQADIYPLFYAYNYRVNHEATHLAMDYINQTQAVKIGMPKSLLHDYRVQFFIDPHKQLSAVTFDATASAILHIQATDLTAVEVTHDTIPILNGIITGDTHRLGYSMRTVTDPLNKPQMVIFEKLTQ